MNIIECIIGKAADVAGTAAFAEIFIKVSSLYKYIGLFI